MLKRKGFTLIELLVVVLIIGILAAIALPQYEKIIARSRLSNCITLADAIAEAEQFYFIANGNYTVDAGKLDIALPAGCTALSLSSIFGYYSCGDGKYVQIYQEGNGGAGRVLVMDNRIPSWILYWFDPKKPHYCGLSKTSPKAELGKKICATYGQLVVSSNPSYWYYEIK